MTPTNNLPVRIRRVVDYLAEHLDESLDLDDIARVAHISPYHFHRLYRGMLGETPGDTVRRLRLSRSAIDLLDRDLNIERVARRAGYASQAAFTRAFRDEYGEPPARYRGTRQAAELEQATSPTLYQVEFVVRPRLRVAAIHCRGDYQITSKAFERLMATVAMTGLLSATTRTFGIFRDDPVSVPQDDLRSTACVTVPDGWMPAGELVEGHVEGGRYASIIHTGPYNELKAAYNWLYQTWLPLSGEEPRDLPCVEEYLNNPRDVPAKDLQTAVMMPLEG
jgi:AraC family transcriptional regulator